MKLRILKSIIFSLFIYFMFEAYNLYQREALRVKGQYLYRWWDVVEVLRSDAKCKATEIIKNLAFIDVECSALEIVKIIKQEVNTENKDTRIAIVPAQALYYKLFKSKKRIDGLRIAWNDFHSPAVSQKSIEKLINGYYCRSREKIIIIIFPTSEKTLKASWKNFGGRNTFENFSQKRIESTLMNANLPCLSRNTYSHDGIIFSIIKNDDM